METSYYIYIGIVVIGLVSFYLFKMRGGMNGYLDRKLGLEENENNLSLWDGYFYCKKTMVNHLSEIAYKGYQKRGLNILIALTDRERLVIGSNESDMPPISINKGELISIEVIKKKAMTLSGEKGLENGDAIRLNIKTSDPIEIIVAQSTIPKIKEFLI